MRDCYQMCKNGQGQGQARPGPGQARPGQDAQKCRRMHKNAPGMCKNAPNMRMGPLGPHRAHGGAPAGRMGPLGPPYGPTLRCGNAEGSLHLYKDALGYEILIPCRRRKRQTFVGAGTLKREFSSVPNQVK